MYKNKEIQQLIKYIESFLESNEATHNYTKKSKIAINLLKEQSNHIHHINNNPQLSLLDLISENISKAIIKINEYGTEESKKIDFIIIKIYENLLNITTTHYTTDELINFLDKEEVNLRSIGLSEEISSTKRRVFAKHIANLNSKDPKSENLELIKTIKNAKDETKILIESKVELIKLEQKIKKLQENLSQYKSAYNFIGLSLGFQNLRKNTNTRSWWSLLSLIALGIIILAIPSIQISYLFSNDQNIEKISKIAIYTAPAIFAIEIVLIYFFRVFLRSYQSLKDQLLQLDLRIALCSFIDTYADHAKTIKERSDVTLEKFETIIFNNILPDGQKLPSTFDGLESIANIIKDLKK